MFVLLSIFLIIINVQAVGSGSGSTPKQTETTTAIPDTEADDLSTTTAPTNTNTITEIDVTSDNPETVNSNVSETTIDCQQDTWQCDDWSDCDSYGNQERYCWLVEDCDLDTTTAEPNIHQPCAELQCGNKITLHDRVWCRLNLTPAAMNRELAIQYLPEECRVLNDTTAQTACIERYKSYQPCWAIDDNAERVDCARSVLNLQPRLADDIRACVGDISCYRELQAKVYDLIKFRFYELEERAEALAEAGVSLEAVTDFIVLIIEKKLDFNQATTTGQRRQVILDVRTGWQNFITQASQDIQ